jgi:ribosomal protein L21E
MKNTMKNGTSITFNRPSSTNHGKTGTVVAKRDKATSPIGVMLEGKAAIVWTAAKFLTVNDQITDSVTVEGFNIGDTVTNTGRGSKSGMTGTVKKLRDAATNVGVEYVEGVTTWCKHTNLTVNSDDSSNDSIFSIGDLVEYTKPGMKKTGSTGTVKKFRADGRVGVNFRGSVITWCDADNLIFAGDDMLDHDDSWDSDDWSDDFNDSADSVVINFKGINITVSKDCEVSITSEGVSVN